MPASGSRTRGGANGIVSRHVDSRVDPPADPVASRTTGRASLSRCSSRRIDLCCARVVGGVFYRSLLARLQGCADTHIATLASCQLLSLTGRSSDASPIEGDGRGVAIGAACVRVCWQPVIDLNTRCVRRSEGRGRLGVHQGSRGKREREREREEEGRGGRVLGSEDVSS